MEVVDPAGKACGGLKTHQPPCRSERSEEPL
jgi:hypothetical protein